jgi:hypothetical protein
MGDFPTPDLMTSQRWVMAPGYVVEPAGAEFGVLCPATSAVSRMTGLAAEVAGRVRSSPRDLPGELPRALPGYLGGAASQLAAVGVIVPAGDPLGALVGAGAGGARFNRREASHLGGAVAPVGVVVLPLPSAAAASSVTPQVSVSGAVKNTVDYGGVFYDGFLFDDPGVGGSFAFTANPPDEMDIAIVDGGGGGGHSDGGGSSGSEESGLTPGEPGGNGFVVISLPSGEA